MAIEIHDNGEGDSTRRQGKVRLTDVLPATVLGRTVFTI